MLLAWSATEVVRYTYFALLCAGVEWPRLTWLRYSAFFPLYPLGIAGELFTLWRAATVAQEEGREGAVLAFGVVMLAYLPGEFSAFFCCCVFTFRESRVLLTLVVIDCRRALLVSSRVGAAVQGAGQEEAGDEEGGVSCFYCWYRRAEFALVLQQLLDSLHSTSPRGTALHPAWHDEPTGPFGGGETAPHRRRFRTDCINGNYSIKRISGSPARVCSAALPQLM